MTDLLRADRAFRYANKELKPGDTFVAASANDAKTLTAVGHATLIEPDYVTPQPVDEVPGVEEVLDSSGEIADVTAEPKRRPGRPRKGTYSRRDLRAEE